MTLHLICQAHSPNGHPDLQDAVAASTLRFIFAQSPFLAAFVFVLNLNLIKPVSVYY